MYRPVRKTFEAAGFTLIELLVVIFMILVLIGIAVPMLSYAKRQANKAATATSLQTIAGGLDAYNAIFNMYPPSQPGYGSTINRGSVMLVQGLDGFLPTGMDGADTTNGGSNYSFRITPNGKGTIYYAYVPPDSKFLKVISANEQVFVDLWGNEILYYRAVPAKINGNTRNIQSVFASGGSTLNGPTFTGIFNSDDNSAVVCQPDANGVTANPDPATGTSGFWQSIGATSNSLSGGEAVSGRDSYLLISGGLDVRYFTNDDVVHSRQ